MRLASAPGRPSPRRVGTTTLLLAVSSFLTTPMLNKAPYDALKDFSNIAFIAQAPLLVVVTVVKPRKVWPSP